MFSSRRLSADIKISNQRILKTTITKQRAFKDDGSNKQSERKCAERSQAINLDQKPHVRTMASIM